MKLFLAFMLTALSYAAFSAELDSIELITPVSYERPSSFTQTMLSKAKSGIGETINYDVKKAVNEEIAPYRKDLQSYFPKSGELDQFVESVSSDGIYYHLSKVGPDGKRYKHITDDKLVSFYGYIGNNLIGKIADRILEKEGVTDPARRQLWVNKLTAPFNSCMQTAMNAAYDASHCMKALTGSLVPSAGIGLVFELSRSNLNGQLPEKERTPFNISLVNMYKQCMAKTKSAASDVKGCALSSMRSGVLKVTDGALTNTINEKASSKTTADSIKKAQWPSFNTCINSVSDGKGAYTDQFMGCIDNLVASTGSALVLDKISSTSAVTSIMLPAEVKKLATEKADKFKKCAEDQKKKGARKDGLLDIDVCENSITNEVTYQVVSQTLRQTAASNFKDEKAVSLKLGNEGVAILDKCWINNQTENAREACLRKTILSFSGSLATIKLDKAIPADMSKKKELTQSSVVSLASCLDKELPASISTANNLTAKIDTCSNRLTKNVAMTVAEHQIRATALDIVSTAQTDKIVDSLVKDEFEKCLGDIPTDEKIEKCGDSLTVKAARLITAIGFEKEVNGYLQKNGGPSAFGLSQNDVNDFIKKLNTQTQACLDKKADAGKAMSTVGTCAKTSIKQIAFYFGDLQFKKSIGDMFKGRDAARADLEKRFKKNLELCLDTKAGVEFSIGDYTKNLYTCSDKISASTTLEVGDDQISSNLDTYLKDRPGQSNAALRTDIKNKLLGNFKKCMSSTPADKQSQCIDSMKREATGTIVLNYGRQETKAQLNTDVTPAELKPIEDELAKCTSKQLAGDALTAHLDECTKQFALNFAKELGTLKLNHLLKSALGSEEFDAQKKNIDAVIGNYQACLNNLKSVSMNDGLTTKLSVCTDMLEEQGVLVVRKSINNWMTSEQKDEATAKIKREFAAFIPCLSVLLPSSPYTPAMEKNVDSVLKPVAEMFAQFIEYDPNNAKITLDVMLKKLSGDLADVDKNKESRKALVDLLYQQGAWDQFIKGIVKGEVSKAFATVTEADVPKELRETLLQKENFEEIFKTPEGENIKKMVLEKILKPVLIDQTDLKTLDPMMKTVKDNVVVMLANSPRFGDQILQRGVQSQINNMGGMTKFFGKMLYGKESFDWTKVRTTEEGKKAEAYIKENILLPKFKSEKRSTEEEKKIAEKAEELVTKAVKGYKH
jgi:hypothetical protein